MARKRTRMPIHAAAALAALALLVATAVQGGDWPQFRGARRDGISNEKGLASSWPESGPKEVWRVAIGEGYSSISVVGKRLYTMYSDGEGEDAVEYAAAFDASTGKELWRTAMGEKKVDQFGNGPRATPSVDGDSVYVLGSFGTFAALSTKDGTPRWKMDLPEEFGGGAPHFGFSTSAVVEDGQVIVEGGGPEGKSYAGIDAKTGEVRWTSGTGGRSAGYSSALPIDLRGEHQYVYITGSQMRGIDKDGNELWSMPWPEGETHAMPVFIAPDKIFASGAEGVGAHLVQLEHEEGTTKAQEIWKAPFMRNHFSSSVVHDGHIYGFDNATLKCIDIKDAKLKWAKRGLGKGSLILADGRLFVLSDRGKLLMLKATADGYEELGSVQALEGRCWTMPTLANGRLYLRNHEEMLAYDLKG